MPWITIIVMLVSYFLSKKSGMSSGGSALVAAGAGAATYYLADPSNGSNLLGIGAADPTPAKPGDPTDTTDPSGSGGTTVIPAPSTGGTTVLPNLGSALGNVGSIAAGAAGGFAIGSFFSNHPYLTLAAVGLAAYLILGK